MQKEFIKAKDFNEWYSNKQLKIRKYKTMNS